MSKKTPIIIVSVVAIIVIVLGLYWTSYLKKAHSTFEDYAAFRGCAGIRSRTDTEGTCTTKSGNNIKIVKLNNQWYLDGDLPVCGLHIGSTCLFNWP
ncbi:MAG: hypothetical protein V4481_03970 [Patescibacteria group bacterium]